MTCVRAAFFAEDYARLAVEHLVKIVDVDPECVDIHPAPVKTLGRSTKGMVELSIEVSERQADLAGWALEDVGAYRVTKH